VIQRLKLKTTKSVKKVVNGSIYSLKNMKIIEK